MVIYYIMSGSFSYYTLTDPTPSTFSTTPVAWLVNAPSAAPKYQFLPIYGNVSSYDKILPNILDVAYFVMPRFKLTIYNTIDYGGTSYVIDNSNGISPLLYNLTSPNINTGKSCVVSWKNPAGQYSSGYSFNQVLYEPPVISSTGTRNVTDGYNSSGATDTTYKMYVFTGNGTITFERLSGNLSVNLFAIGGGGAGGSEFRGAHGVGGGGAGEIYSGTITIPQNTSSTFTITIGQGGTYSGLGTTTQGTGDKGGNTTVSFTSISTNPSPISCNGGGGGGAGSEYNPTTGGSGGGGAGSYASAAGNTRSSYQPTYRGGAYSSTSSPSYAGYGGGGAGEAGLADASNNNGGSGGSGTNCILPGMNQTWFFGGGGGGSAAGTNDLNNAYRGGRGGKGGGGGGGCMKNGSGTNYYVGAGGTNGYLSGNGNNGSYGLNIDPYGANGGNALANSGSGGGGGNTNKQSLKGYGGSGIVIITFASSGIPSVS